MKKIGIVTVLYKSDLVLYDFFESIGIQDYTNFILYIIDNSANETTKNLVFKLANEFTISEKIKYIPSPSNIGVAAGNNVGIKEALNNSCDYILLSNNDILIKDSKLFTNIVTKLDHKETSIVIPKIHFYNTNEIWFISGYVNKFRAKCFHTNNYTIDEGQFDNLVSCDYAPTCFMIFKKEVFQKIGLMDENYFVYYDDTDFLWRCMEGGYKVSIFTGGVIEHKEGKSTGGQTSDFSFYYYTRNRFYFSSKINKSFLIKYASFFYIFTVSLLRSVKHKKTKLYFKLINKLLSVDKFDNPTSFPLN